MKVLVVDDSVVFRRQISEVLEDFNLLSFHPVSAFDPELMTKACRLVERTLSPGFAAVEALGDYLQSEGTDYIEEKYG